MLPTAWKLAPWSIVLVCAPALALQTGAKSAFTPRSATGLVPFPWEITFADGLDAEEYARQLDYFKIEIAAVSRDGSVDYISRVSQPKPTRRMGSQASDDRLRIGWTKGTLGKVDQRLLRAAGVTTTGKQLLHFFPHEVQDELARLEQAYAGRKPDEIRRTLFRIRPGKTKGEYQFEVVEQVPPKPTQPGARRKPQADFQSYRHTPCAVRLTASRSQWSARA